MIAEGERKLIFEQMENSFNPIQFFCENMINSETFSSYRAVFADLDDKMQQTVL